MALAEIRFFGASVGFQTTMNVILPESGKGPFPVFYLLHGLSDDHTTWTRRSNIERYVAGLPLIVVMPFGHRGWYSNSHANPQERHEDHIVKDVVGIVDRMFPTIAGREGRVLGGLSMGGYGAVKLALKYPNMFCSAVSHSGATHLPVHHLMQEPEKHKESIRDCRAIFGPDWEGGPNDCVALAKRCPKKLRPQIRFDCGKKDFLLRMNREFHRELTGLNYPHEYREFPGGHEWGYWDEHVLGAIAFHRRVLGI